MARQPRVTKTSILELARAIVAQGGTGALTYQALAKKLGVTKQAIIYWYPSKDALARDLMLPALRGETERTIAAMEGAPSAAAAIERFLRALIAYHVEDLGRFRLLYTSARPGGEAPGADFLDEVHGITSPMYAALAAKLSASGTGEVAARRRAVATHMAGIGLLTMVGLAESIGDPLAHGTDDLTQALVALLTGRGAAAPRRPARKPVDSTPGIG